MGVRFFTTTALYALVLGVITLAIISVGQAEVRSSTNYQLESDSLNFAGGYSSSSNYKLQSTAGEIATGDSDSASYSLRAGYQQMQQVFISMTAPDLVVMSPAIGGITGGTAHDSTSVVVLTDSPSGYELSIAAMTSPAMQKGADTILDYVPASSPDPDFSFITSSTDYHFGFSPEGSDITNQFRDNGLLCNIGSGDTALSCWAGLATTSIVIAEGVANQPSGATTTLQFRVGVGGGVVVPAGDYYATTTLTALPL